MELDTGASLSVISEMTYQIWDGRGPPLQPTDVRLKTYTGETLQVKGKINVHVQYEGQEEALSLLVVAGAGPSLLGRDWLHKIKLNWRSLNHMPMEGLVKPLFKLSNSLSIT